MRLKLKKILGVFLTAFLIIPFISAARVAAEDIVTIHYDGENHTAIALIGAGNGGSYEVAARYPKTALQTNLGKRIKSIMIYPYDLFPTTIKLYKGTSGDAPDKLVYSKSVNTALGWNTFDIDEKILITDDDLWAVYEVNTVFGQYCGGVDDGPGNPDGGYYRSIGGNWRKLTDYGIDCNWNLRIELVSDNTAAPVISNFSINNNQNITNNPSVSLNINASDDFTSSSELKMRLSNNNTDWSEWEAYSSQKDWILSSGDGEKTVFIQVKDEKGNVAAGSDSILMDTAPPVFSVSGNPTIWTNKNVTLKITASDEVSKLNDNGAYSFDGGKTWTKDSSKTFTQNGTVNIKVRDNSGSTASKVIIIDKIDKIPPVIRINPYPVSNTDKSITVTVSTNEGTLNAESYTFTKNGSFDFTAVDAAGNKTIKRVTMSNIVSGLPKTGSIFDFSLMVMAGMAMIILGFRICHPGHISHFFCMKIISSRKISF